MKKVIFSFLATAMFSSFSFANTPTLENEIDVKNENQIEANKKETKEDEAVCSVSCSITVNGVSFMAEAGNWFSSCERAGRVCVEKLEKALDASIL